MQEAHPTRFLSLFSGIEAASSAWSRLGWQCAAVSEIDPFACAVLAARHPHVQNLGDVTRITEEQVRALGQLRVIIFGSPCQDLSVAGKRAGLAGERSGLFHDAVRIVRWARKYCGLRFALWENVPGALSSHGGRDFAVVLAELSGLAGISPPPEGWGNEGAVLGPESLVEWASLDAQWFGVAQRRERVFALADFGDWASRPAILLEPESLRGDPPARRGARQEVAACLTPSALDGSGACGGDGRAELMVIQPYTVANTLTQRMHKGINSTIDEGQTPVLAVALRGREGGGAAELGDEIANALSTGGGGGGGGGNKPHALVPEVASTLAAGSNDTGGHRQPGMSADCAAGQLIPMAFDCKAGGKTSFSIGAVAGALRGDVHGGGHAAMQQGMRVRRLTPMECERLQGFPDGYTLVQYNGKPAKDGPRYKALGNSMADPVIFWIGTRIAAVLEATV